MFVFVAFSPCFIKNTVLLGMRVFVYITLLMVVSNQFFCQDSLATKNVTTGIAIFHNDGLTGAHKKLKFGTYVKVRNLKNDSVVIVKITDRLPQKSKRTIDLTLRAAKQLNFVKSGLTKVEITVLDSLQNK